MSVLRGARHAEVRHEEETARLAALTTSTLEYMIDHGEALEARLRRHQVDLVYIAEDEHDLLEAIRLAERQKRVEMNVARTARRNERLRAELVGRGSPGQPPSEPPYSAFTRDVGRAKGGLDEE